MTCLRILVASSHERRREMLTAVLEFCGYETEAVAGGVDCLARLRRRPPDVLVLDQHLHWGGADGVLACLRADCDGRCPPVVLLTSAPGEWAASAPVLAAHPAGDLLVNILESVHRAVLAEADSAMPLTDSQMPHAILPQPA